MNTFSGKKIPLFELVVCLVSTFTATSKKKAIADAHRNFINLSGENISRSSFWQRLANRKLVDFLEKAVLNSPFKSNKKHFANSHGYQLLKTFLSTTPLLSGCRHPYRPDSPVTAATIALLA